MTGQVRFIGLDVRAAMFRSDSDCGSTQTTRTRRPRKDRTRHQKTVNPSRKRAFEGLYYSLLAPRVPRRNIKRTIASGPRADTLFSSPETTHSAAIVAAGAASTSITTRRTTMAGSRCTTPHGRLESLWAWRFSSADCMKVSRCLKALSENPAPTGPDSRAAATCRSKKSFVSPKF